MGAKPIYAYRYLERMEVRGRAHHLLLLPSQVLQEAPELARPG